VNNRITDLEKKPLSRRQFLGQSGAVAAGMAGAAGVLRSAAAQSATDSTPNNTVVLGVIGCGRRGTELIEAVSGVPGAVVVSVCDVDARRSAATAEQVNRLFGSRPATTSDYRDVLDTPGLHGVIIATPGHWHASQLLSACAAEKDVYVETPLCLYMTEANAMVYAAQKYKRVVQVGLQHRSSSRFTEAAGIVRSGNLGRIAQTRTWTFARNEPIAQQPDSPAPASLDYDRWLGPAPERPHNVVRVGHPDHFWDYGSGEAAAWNVHLQELVHTAMRVNVPKSVVAVGGNYGLADFRETPDTLDAIFEYESPTGRFLQTYSLRLSNAYAGWGPAALPPAGPATGSLPARNGVQFFGSDKTLFINGSRLLFLPAAEESPIEDLQFLGIGTHEATTRPAQVVDPLTVAHVKNFVECVRSRKEPSASIEAGQWAMFPCIAANIAYRVGRKLYIKADSLEFFADPALKNADTEANALRYRPYREAYPPPKV
jgi:predicted dehydrogenase